MNVCFNYLYRDAGNFKNWSEVIFTNKTDTELNLLELQIRNFLIDGEFFVAEEVDLKKLYFPKYIKKLDHDWHEFHSIETTEETLNDKNKRDIIDFIEYLKVSCKKQKY